MNLSYICQKLIKKIFNRCAVKNSSIDKTARMDIGSVVSDSRIGRYSYIGEHTSLLYTQVGDFTSISNYCAIGGGNHPIEWVSMSPMFNNTKGILKKRFSDNVYNAYSRTLIGSDVWIGSHCLVKGGITIGDGAVIGMGSVLTKDVGPYEIWAGNPARFIRNRFDDDTKEKLLEMKWWDMDENEIKEMADRFNDPARVIGAVLKEPERIEVES